MKISKQLGWMLGLGLLSFTLVGVGTTSKPPEAQAAADSAPVCPPYPPMSEEAPKGATVASVVPQGVGTGGAGGSGPPVHARRTARDLRVAAARAKGPVKKAPTTDLVFFPLWARQ